MPNDETITEPEEDESLDPTYMDFVPPTIALSLTVAVSLLWRPERSMLLVEDQFKNGHLSWIVVLLAIGGSIFAFLTSKRSFIELLVNATLSGVVAGAFVIRFPRTPFLDPAVYFPAGSAELFAYFYFALIASFFVPSVSLAVSEALFVRLFQWEPGYVFNWAKGRLIWKSCGDRLGG